MAQNEVPAEVFEIRLTPSLVSYIEGTGAYQGTDEPKVGKELHSLRYTKRGARGPVSLYVLGWLLDMIESCIGMRGDIPAAEQRAAQNFSDKWSKVYADAEKAEKERKEEKESAGMLGKPVHHVRTGEIVGYLYQGPEGDKWTPVEEVSE